MSSTSENWRIEHDTMGEVRVPADALYGAQTQRAVENFPISGSGLESAQIVALARIKRAAAIVNKELGIVDGAIADAIVAAAGSGRVDFVPWPPDRDAIDIGSYFGDSSKAKRVLGWEPRTSFADGIARTLAFYRARAAWYL